MKAISPYTYRDYYFCSNGCGPKKGWIRKGEQERSPKGTFRCPFCHRQLRTKSRFAFGRNRLKEPMRI